MTTTEIPVEVRLAAMRADADLLDEHHDHHGAHLLRAEADQIETEEKLLDELAAEAYRYVGAQLKSSTNWDTAVEAVKEMYRGLIRSVLDKLEDTKTEHRREPRQWANLRDVPDDVREVIGCDTNRFQRDSSSPSGWIWAGNGGQVGAVGMTICSPYTEVIDD